jgi:hypothetical protein
MTTSLHSPTDPPIAPAESRPSRPRSFLRRGGFGAGAVPQGAETLGDVYPGLRTRDAAVPVADAPNASSATSSASPLSPSGLSERIVSGPSVGDVARPSRPRLRLQAWLRSPRGARRASFTEVEPDLEADPRPPRRTPPPGRFDATGGRTSATAGGLSPHRGPLPPVPPIAPEPPVPPEPPLEAEAPRAAPLPQPSTAPDTPAAPAHPVVPSAPIAPSDPIEPATISEVFLDDPTFPARVRGRRAWRRAWTLLLLLVGTASALALILFAMGRLT